MTEPGRRPARDARALAAGLLVLAGLAVAVAGCARKISPSGGPPDVAAPTLLALEPDSGAAGVESTAIIRLAFSEPMDRLSVQTSLLVAPGVRSGVFRWESARSVTYQPERPLARDRAFVVLLGPAARDARGNALERPVVAHFTTAATFAPGTIDGRVDGRGVQPDGVYVWAYREDRGRVPDSTALDMDALGQARGGGLFRLVGLAVPGTYRLWAFVDRNRNRTFEPAADLLVRSDSLVALAADAPQASGVRVAAVDPEALARVEGAVVDSLAPGAAALRIEARAVPRAGEAADRAPVIAIDALGTRFAGSLRAGRWRLTAWRDLDGDRTLSASEPRSAPLEVDLEPAETRGDLVLVLAPVPGASP
ncbi:MAG: Ig-like domain-containing protein [Candidatus Eisenbacteria bacterium]